MITHGIEKVDGEELHVPRIVCDACSHPITGAGNVYWLVRDDGEVLPQVWHTHKAPCSGFDRAIESHFGPGMVLSEELDVWLHQIHNNFTREARS